MTAQACFVSTTTQALNHHANTNDTVTLPSSNLLGDVLLCACDVMDDPSVVVRRAHLFRGTRDVSHNNFRTRLWFTAPDMSPNTYGGRTLREHLMRRTDPLNLPMTAEEYEVARSFFVTGPISRALCIVIAQIIVLAPPVDTTDDEDRIVCVRLGAATAVLPYVEHRVIVVDQEGKECAAVTVNPHGQPYHVVVLEYASGARYVIDMCSAIHNRYTTKVGPYRILLEQGFPMPLQDAVGDRTRAANLRICTSSLSVDVLPVIQIASGDDGSHTYACGIANAIFAKLAARLSQPQ